MKVLPGSQGSVESFEDAVKIASEIGYPIIIKAVAGGGGRGMRIVRVQEDLKRAFSTAQSEAQIGFGVPDVYIEKYLESPRHIEFQIMADEHGNVINFGERECSIQRRHQKLVEEAPSVVVDQKCRMKMGKLVEEAMTSVGYSNAGTVEFLVDEDLNFYFGEMNTRIQVEHPVTEMVTGSDLVKMQIQIAAGKTLEREKNIQLKGHSIECRINAEDPETMWPSPGKITSFNVPGGSGIRVETAVYSECIVSPHYDPMIAKLVAWAPSRMEAIQRMERALEMFVIEGIRTSIPLQRKIMRDADFRAGQFNTKFMERYLKSN